MVPLDIELEIIKRLPIKTLIRFMSVCKAWKSFIKCSEFVTGYSHRVLPTQPHRLLINYEAKYKQESGVKYVCFVDDDDDDDDDTFPQQKVIVPPVLQPNIINSSQGLLSFHGFNSMKNKVVLWNPSIRKSVYVAVPNVLPRPFSYVVGFGVCPDTLDPKLVKITYIDRWHEIQSIIPRQVEVFTLSSGEWKISSGNLPRTSISYACFQVVVGQFIYWLAYDKINDHYGHNLIMSFDLRSQEFREIDLPDSLKTIDLEEDGSLFISRLKESLAVFEFVMTDFPHKKICHVWMMERSEAFTKIFTVDLPNTSVSWILGFTRSGKPIVEMQDDIKDVYATNALVVYELVSELIKDLGIYGDTYSFFGTSYAESLLLLDHDDGHIVSCGAMKK